MTPETKKQALEKLHAVANKIGYPDKWRDYSSREDRARRRARQFGARRTNSSSHRQIDKDRQAGGPHRMADDAADRERLLRSAR